MKPIDKGEVQKALDNFLNRDVYLHLETTKGAYAAHHNGDAFPFGAYIRNGKITIQRGTIAGEGPFRIGLKMELGWVYAEGLTDWEVDEEGRLLLAGHDQEGRLGVALQLSLKPF